MNQIETLCLHHYNDVFNYVYGLLNDEYITQEIVQETFVRLCENPEGLSETDSQKAKVWAIEMARHLTVNYVHESGRVAIEGMDSHSIICSKENLEEKIQTQELRDFLKVMLKKLKIEHQEAIYLVDIQQMSYREGAFLLGISEEAFGSLLKRARRALIRIILKEYNPELLKLPLSLYEQKMLFTWFDVLDYPNNIEGKVNSKIQDFFNGFHENFEPFRRDTYPHDLNKYLQSFVELNQSSVAADFGSGTGSLIKEISPIVSKVFAIDHSVEMHKTLNELMQTYSLWNVETILADVSEGLPLIEEKVNIGFCCMLLHHVFNPSKAIKYMAQTLVPGGELVIADLTYTNKNWVFKESHDFWTGFKLEQFKTWLEEAELEIIQLIENEEYKFRFTDLHDKDKSVEVPLLVAHCRKKK